MQVDEVVKYINKELLKNRTMKDIEENDFNENKGVILKRLNRKGYKKIENQFVFVSDPKDTTLKTTKILHDKVSKNQYFVNFSDDELIKLKTIVELDIDKLKKILEKNTTAGTTKSIIQDKTTKVTSVRLNQELYQKLKTYAKKNNIQLVDIFEDMMLKYLSDKIQV
jgi:hypothetical protein